ncbi:hypothetical protein AX17_005806 [Amanita inopinata Kibby_2008]|nr:hypothetical protein AX17_005806 [Amanita inopinata Kibby_2008]
MSAIPDDYLFQYASRTKDKVVLITGAANGIGRETALQFAAHGAKVVIGDLDVTGAKKVVNEIERAGGNAIYRECNVTRWDEQVDLFESAMSTFGSVDIVVPNAGISEAAPFTSVKLEAGRPVKPKLSTIDVNLVGTLYTTHLAQHYLILNKKPGQLKAVVLIGSMASWLSLPRGELYAASKHAVLGLMRSISITFAMQDIRTACIHPFFADTAIVPIPVKVFLAGLPLATVPRIAGAIFYAATNPDPATSGSAWLIPDDGPVFMVPKEEFKFGVYEMIDKRANALLKTASGIVYYSRIARDLGRILGKPMLIAGLAIAAVKIGWSHGYLVIS